MSLILEILALLAVGWVAGAEIGSWFGIQPVVDKLPYEQQVSLEQAMLKTFGRIMPILMPFSAVFVALLTVFSQDGSGFVFWMRSAATFCIVITIVTTLTINVPINRLTAKWQISEDPGNWSRMRKRWHLFQGIRGGLFLVSFALLAIARTI